MCVAAHDCGGSAPATLPCGPRNPSLVLVDWQMLVVVALAVLALGYLASRFFGPRPKKKNPNKPDVDVRALVRRR